MRHITIEKTQIKKSQLKPVKDSIEAEELATYKDLIEMTLDLIPQGGFTLKEIRNRNRIQEALDNIKNPKSNEGTPILELEDSDYGNLCKLVEESRWASRDKEIETFLSIFTK